MRRILSYLKKSRVALLAAGLGAMLVGTTALSSEAFADRDGHRGRDGGRYDRGDRHGQHNKHWRGDGHRSHWRDHGRHRHYAPRYVYYPRPIYYDPYYYEPAYSYPAGVSFGFNFR